MGEPDEQLAILGEYLRTQRQLANLSLRQLAAMSEVSNPYLSQIERGLHEPSVRVLKALAEALNISAETLLVQAGLLQGAGPDPTETSGTASTEATITADPCLTPTQREALLSVYRSYLSSNQATQPQPPVA